MAVDNVSTNYRVYYNSLKPANSNNSSNIGEDFSSVLNSAVANKETINLDQIFAAAAEKYNVPVSLLKAVARAESNFNPNAQSRSGAQGIMQLMPATARSLGVTNSFDAEQNIMGGAKYISQMLKRFGNDTKLALAAYNAGPNNILKYGGVPPFKETQNYVTRVMAYCGDNITAGNVAGNPVTTKDTQLFLQNIGLPGTLNGEDLDKMDYALLLKIYQYRLQANLLADTDSSEV